MISRPRLRPKLQDREQDQVKVPRTAVLPAVTLVIGKLCSKFELTA